MFFNIKYLLLTLLFAPTLIAQTTKIDTKFNRLYYLKVSQFRALPNCKDEIVFLGNSIIEGGAWSELFKNIKIKNRGISGDITEGILNRLDEVTESNPSKIFLLIGINDLAHGIEIDSVYKNYEIIIKRIIKDSPQTLIYIHSLLPVNDKFYYFKNHTNKGKAILALNKKLINLAKMYNQKYIDLYSKFVNEEGKLKEEYTIDGVHLTGKGYLLWKSILDNFLL